MPADLIWNIPKIHKQFRGKLLTWYGQHRRDLPWRRTHDPYCIWVSEIMLQQTRVAAVLEHYRKFLKAFPTVRHLARAGEADVLAQWSGLGYYRRARMLHAAANLVVKDQGAQIPRSALELRMLPGIGRYTSNAIASIAFGEPVAVVDGNVGRVLHRMSDGSIKGEAAIWSAADKLLDPASPGDFNQAVMELGATVCVPGVPDCVRCPVKTLCQTHRGGHNPSIPSNKQVRTRRSASLLLSIRKKQVALRQRHATESLMAGMWELPENMKVSKRQPLLALKHSITTTDWAISVFTGYTAPRSASVRWVPLDEVSRLPLTGLTRKILRRLNLIT
jgi:A/G-specific adenine glycosylase